MSTEGFLEDGSFTVRTRILHHATNHLLLNKAFLTNKLNLPLVKISGKGPISAFGNEYSCLGVVRIRWAPPLSNAAEADKLQQDDYKYLMSRTIIESTFVVVQEFAPFDIAIDEQTILDYQRSEQQPFINPDLTSYRIFQETILVRLQNDGPWVRAVARTYPRCQELFITKSCLFDLFGCETQLSSSPSTPGWFDYNTNTNHSALGSVRLQWGPPLYAFNVAADMGRAKEDSSRDHKGITSGWDTFWVLPDDVPFDILVGRNDLHSWRTELRTEDERSPAELHDQAQSSSQQNETEGPGEGNSRSPPAGQRTSKMSKALSILSIFSK
jgi:hypothetical protein